MGPHARLVSVLPRIPERWIAFGESEPSKVVPFGLKAVLEGNEDKTRYVSGAFIKARN